MIAADGSGGASCQCRGVPRPVLFLRRARRRRAPRWYTRPPFQLASVAIAGRPVVGRRSRRVISGEWRMRPKDNRPRQTNGDAVLCLCYYGGRKKRFIGTPPRPHLQPSPPPLDDGELNKNPPTPPRRSAVPHHKAELGGRCPRGAETNPWVWSKQSSRKKTKKKSYYRKTRPPRPGGARHIIHLFSCRFYSREHRHIPGWAVVLG